MIQVKRQRHSDKEVDEKVFKEDYEKMIEGLNIDIVDRVIFDKLVNYFYIMYIKGYKRCGEKCLQQLKNLEKVIENE